MSTEQAIPSPAGHAISRSKRCGARLRGERKGKFCRQWAMPNGRCKMHGGNAPAGTANGFYKHGRYSKVLPKGLLAKYETAGADPDLHNLAEEIRLVDARMGDLLAQLSKGGGQGRMREALTLVEQFKTAATTGQVETAKTVIDQLEQTLRAGLSVESTWDKVFSAADLRRKLVESDTKQKQSAQRSLPVERVLLFAQAVAHSIDKNVTSQTEKAAVMADLRSFGLNRWPD